MAFGHSVVVEIVFLGLMRRRVGWCLQDAKQLETHEKAPNRDKNTHTKHLLEIVCDQNLLLQRDQNRKNGA